MPEDRELLRLEKKEPSLTYPVLIQEKTKHSFLDTKPKSGAAKIIGSAAFNLQVR